ncbi:MAG TPA: intradiol ring-cleavage dioxygenase [Burkholderiales bacterium]|nr:intradiol ring-cleavage dioxygenase [Burkholderiales bacterium]
MAIRHFSEKTLTAEVLKRVGKAPDKRTRQVMQSLVKHLHAFVREVRPTQQEWFQGIQFLTKTGHLCDDKRQEFILMSDTLGVSMLVDFINYGKATAGKMRATESTVLGPFFVEGAPELPLGASIAKAGTPGEPCAVSGTVKDLKGKPVAGATIDVWEGGADGLYDVQKPEGTNLRAQFRSDAQGRFHFKCITPVSYPVPHDGPVGQMLVACGRHPMRPGHLHFTIEAAGYEKLVTHLFVKGDKYLDSDAVFGVKESLIVDYRKNKAGVAECRYGFVLKKKK